MQTILSLDFTTQPALIQTVEVEDGKVRIIESVNADLDLSALRNRDNAEHLNEAPESESAAGGSNGVPHREQNMPVEDPAQTAPGDLAETSYGHAAAAPKAPAKVLRQEIARLKNTWTSSVVLLPPHDYFSFNLDLPFGTAKTIEKILDLEVQDRVPFDLNEFLVEYRVLGQMDNKNSDVHVSIIPKYYIKNVLEVCHAAELDPIVLTTPGSTMAGLTLLKPERFPGNSLFVLQRQPHSYIACAFDGVLRADRVFSFESSQSLSAGRSSADVFAAEIGLSLGVIEKRYQKEIDKVYLIDPPPDYAPPAAIAGRPVQVVFTTEVIDSNGATPGAATLAALFARDSAAPVPLTNFRTREFAYSLHFGELLNGFKRLLPWLAAALTCLLLMLALVYHFKNQEMEKLQAEMHRNIREVLPEVQLEPGREAASIQQLNSRIEKQLEDLGSPSKFSPLDLLLDISKNFPSSNDVSITNMSISGNQIEVKGVAESYKTIDALETALKARKTVFCRVNKEMASMPTGAKGGRAFTIDIRVCE